MNAVESKGEKVYYCDTDSIITSCDLSKYSDLMNEYVWDGTGDDLGSLKNEAEDKVKKYAKKHKDFDVKQTLNSNLKFIINLKL